MRIPVARHRVTCNVTCLGGARQELCSIRAAVRDGAAERVKLAAREIPPRALR